MQYTPNYNLITVEGTDVVNPLVQMNPNFTDIDAAMFANKQAVIGTATEITSGTVHSITRANPDSNYFRFTATSNWNAGDSMSVDGVNVSVFLSNGNTPNTGAYIINTEVLAIISGSRVTLLVSNNDTTTLTASDVTYDNTASGLTSSNVQNAVDEVASIVKSNTLGTAVTLTEQIDYVAPEDGYILAVLPTASTQSLTVFVNTVAFIVISPDSTTTNASRQSLFVRKGMTIRYVGAEGQVYFVPFA